MDEQNNPGGSAPSEPTASDMPSTPPAAEPPVPTGTPTASEPASGMASPPPPQPVEQKCITCGKNAVSDGNCVGCGQGELSCTCPLTSQGGNTPPAI